MTLEDLNAILEAGRRYGLKLLRVDAIGLLVEYAPGPPPPIGELKRITSVVDAAERIGDETGPPLCPCGHSLYEHASNGLCFFSCEPAKCRAKEEATP